MRPIFLALAIIMSAAPAFAQDKIVLVIHGGAGATDKKNMTPEAEKQYRDRLEQALKAGHKAIVEDKGSSLDGVEAAIKSHGGVRHFQRRARARSSIARAGKN